jgi:DNA-binding response OmpR family regulator
MLPGIDGFEVCRRIRAKHDVPVVMLTARGDDADRIVGLEIGAVDYVPKPFNPRELLARLRAVLRRTKKSGGPEKVEKIVVGPIAIDLGTLTVRRDGEDVPVTSYELRILVALAKRAGETVTREELAAEVREPTKTNEKYDPSVDRSLDVHVSRLRQKLEDDPKEPRLIKTVRGVGYVLTRPSS